MIYLASASPRRQELLRQLGLAFEVVPSGIEEARQPAEAAADYVARVALDKARHVAARLHAEGRADGPVLGADTEVVLEDRVFGKPGNARASAEMLNLLAGRSHEVLSGIALVAGGREWTALSRSRVYLAPMSAAEIEGYCATGEPLDKAGGYAIQGRAAAFIERIEGSYSGVMGLPLHELYMMLREAGVA
jgi:septum formation protein